MAGAEAEQGHRQRSAVTLSCSRAGSSDSGTGAAPGDAGQDSTDHLFFHKKQLNESQAGTVSGVESLYFLALVFTEASL